MVDGEKCAGLTSKRTRCAKNVDNNDMYCNSHKYFENFTDEQIDDIKLGGNNNLKACPKCLKWRIKSEYIDEMGKEFIMCKLCRNKPKN